MSRQRALAKEYVSNRRDMEETIKVLRLQAWAWRMLAMIAVADPDKARATAPWLLFNSVPFVNGPAIEKWIAENQDYSDECAVKAGVVHRKAAEVA